MLMQINANCYNVVVEVKSEHWATLSNTRVQGALRGWSVFSGSHERQHKRYERKQPKRIITSQNICKHMNGQTVYEICLFL